MKNKVFMKAWLSAIAVGTVVATSTAPVLAQNDPATDIEETVNSEEELPELKNSEEESSEPKNSEEIQKAQEMVLYSGHQESRGDLSEVTQGTLLGSMGEARRLEAVTIHRNNASHLQGEIIYRTHLQNIGWQQDWCHEGELSGTKGQARRAEAIQIKLTGELEQHYDIYYRVHSQNIGTLNWVKNGEMAGTTGMCMRMEAVQICLLPKGEVPSGYDPSDVKFGYLDLNVLNNFYYGGTQEGIGELNTAYPGNALGKTGLAKRLESFWVIRDTSKESPYEGAIRYRVNIEGYGWQDDVNEGTSVGAPKEGKRMETLAMSLTGKLGEKCNIWYRTHVENFGWLGWAKSGEKSGSQNYNRRIESVQVQIRPKWMGAPGNQANHYHEARPASYQGAQQFQKISHFSTVSRNTANGFHNMALALAHFDGYVLQPGQVLSFNRTAGPFSRGNGYKVAGVVGGSGYGGGVCQASTTIYGAATRAGLDIVRRRNHSIASIYVPRGQDAMVSWGSSDLQIRNNYPTPIRLHTWVAGNELHVEIYGNKPYWFDKINVESWVTGRHSASARRVYYKNGNVVKIENLPNSYYRN